MTALTTVPSRLTVDPGTDDTSGIVKVRTIIKPEVGNRKQRRAAKARGRKAAK